MSAPVSNYINNLTIKVKMDDLNIDFDIHTRCQFPHDFMSTCDFSSNKIVYQMALDRYTSLNRLVMYLASKYTMKEKGFIKLR